MITCFPNFLLINSLIFSTAYIEQARSSISSSVPETTSLLASMCSSGKNYILGLLAVEAQLEQCSLQK